ncbi:MAG: class I SAM-dependent rRNA methyltransferase [Candidatus Eisenbacteria bacterium]|uniref:Class I SAM-dependent rRNA methyltransferase n=1 Tax=Eiseniibacteriota bacterium TaxID=2212470 RepID=A0A933SBN3_UNCEI|nr:class I SAM-dependent rRNA methyltransferase [Candidatus Eisenbacteria bacterium]
MTASANPTGTLILRRGEDRRVRGGHPWIFSNEVERWDGAVEDGGLVEITDSRGAFLGIAYVNRHSLICARVLTRGRDTIDRAFFVKRLERARRLRETCYPGETCVRLVYGESDQLPGLVVDRYGDWLAVQVLTRGMDARTDVLREALEEVFAPKGAVYIGDSALRELEGLPQRRETWWGTVPERVEATVGGFSLRVDLVGGQKTGLFLDQRENRRRAESRAKGRRALDCFCYQGEWALHMARGGATEVVAIDSSEPALQLAQGNASRAGYDGLVSFRRGTAFDELRKFERDGERFGIAVVDPPALIKSRKHVAAGVRAYRELNRAAMGLLEEDGVLVTCSCSHHLDDAMFRQVLLEAARLARRPMRVLDWAGEAPDHPQLLAVPETHYLKCAVLQAL